MPMFTYRVDILMPDQFIAITIWKRVQYSGHHLNTGQIGDYKWPFLAANFLIDL
jgi:hypothetical protein